MREKAQRRLLLIQNKESITEIQELYSRRKSLTQEAVVRYLFGCCHYNKASIDRKDSSKNYEPGNVRWVEDYSIQNINRRTPKHNTSGVKGVSWYPKYNKWLVRININKKRKNLGYYESFEEAVNVRKKAEQEYYNVST